MYTCFGNIAAKEDGASFMRQLFEKTTLGGILVKNRLVRSATLENAADDQGRYIQAMSDLYENLAKGGVGLIITGMVSVDENSSITPYMIKTYDETFPDRLKSLADILHTYNTRLVVQLSHCGKDARKLDSGLPPIAPSRLEGTEYREFSQDDLHALAKSFAQAARRCQEAGADGVELHAAHGYLLSQFLCPHFNRRTDAYGGPIENRARIIFEIYDAIRAAVGPKYPIWIKINSWDMLEDGMTKEESLWVCQKLSEMGINAIEVSGGAALSKSSTPVKKIHSQEEEGYFLQEAAAISLQVPTDVISVGGYRTFEIVEHALNQGNIQAISLSRALTSEPDLPKRWMAGEHVRSRCVSCNGCFRFWPLYCGTFAKKDQAES